MLARCCGCSYKLRGCERGVSNRNFCSRSTCVYRKPRFGSTGDEVHQGSAVNERFRSDAAQCVYQDPAGGGGLPHSLANHFARMAKNASATGTCLYGTTRIHSKMPQ